MKSVYRLSGRIAGFDFFPWLVRQVIAGATEIVFDTRNPNTNKWPLEKVLLRYESILLPGPALAGLKCSVDSGKRLVELASGSQNDLVQWCKLGIPIPRLRTVLPAEKVRYTVTLRATQRIPERNSNEQVWRDFASEIDALVIEDYELKPLHLHQRMALYAGAEQNFFVTNGPSMLCFLSEYPAMAFDVNMSPMTNMGIPRGGRYPFLLPQHHQIYETPTRDVLHRYFDAWLKERQR